jgi:hypothetical protein
MRSQLVEYLVDDLAIGPYSDGDEIEFRGRHRGDRSSVGRVVRRREELAREYRELLDFPCYRSLVGSADTRTVRCVDEDGLSQHREVTVPGTVDVSLTHEPGRAARDATDRECRGIRLLPDGRSSSSTTATFVSNGSSMFG